MEAHRLSGQEVQGGQKMHRSAGERAASRARNAEPGYVDDEDDGAGDPEGGGELALPRGRAERA
jgi:hypothetical protein